MPRNTVDALGASPPDPLDAPRVTPQQLLAAMPPAVREAFPDPSTFPMSGWTEETLWRLDLPIWRWEGRRFQLSLRQVLEDRERYRAHHEKAARADTSLPIHVAERGGRWVILDGYHRLLKVLLQGAPTIKVVKVRARDLAPPGPRPW